MIKRTILFPLLLAASGSFAQVSLDELDDAMESRNKELSAFQERLNDPDPDRALAAMKLLISKGDTDQRRLAIRHGLSSTDIAFRVEAVRAIFDSGPTLTMHMTPTAEPSVYFLRAIKNSRGVVGDDNSSRVTFKIVGYDDKEECWQVNVNNRAQCFVRMRAADVSIFYGNSWGTYQLNNVGQLEGDQTVVDTLTRSVVELSE